MAAKAKPKPKAKTKAKPKAKAKPVRKAAPPKGPALSCKVCGFRVIVDELCGCVEEHVLLCCGQPMQKA